MTDSGKECVVCYEEKRLVDCFHGCSAQVCVDCIKKIIKFNHQGKILYKCPMCRQNVINRRKKGCECTGSHSSKIDKKFSRFCLKVSAITSKIFEMYEKEVERSFRRNYDSDDEDEDDSMPDLISEEEIIEEEEIIVLQPPTRQLRANAENFIPEIVDIGHSVRIRDAYHHIETLNTSIDSIPLTRSHRITSLASRNNDFFELN